MILPSRAGFAAGFVRGLGVSLPGRVMSPKRAPATGLSDFFEAVAAGGAAGAVAGAGAGALVAVVVAEVVAETAAPLPCQQGKLLFMKCYC
jgi:hypothetical protein